MLTVHHLNKSFGIQPILRDISFSISNNERIGLIGPNGSGKTTLMRILAGLEQPDSGSVAPTIPNLRTGYLAQGMQIASGQTLESSLGLPGDPGKLAAEIGALAAVLAANPKDPIAQARYDEVVQTLSSADYQPQAILRPLGLADLSLDAPVEHLSGGQKTRLMLARVLLQEPKLLLLDEPTNHLDIVMLEWLENWLGSFSGAALVISHDRAFLDHTTRSILDLDPHTHTIRAYPGNYTDYLALHLREQQRQSAAYDDQQAEMRRMRQDIVRTKQQALRVELSTTPRQPGVRRIAKKVAVKAKSREKKLHRYMQSEDRVERPRAAWQIKLEFDAPAQSSKLVLHSENLSVGYKGAEPILSGLNLEIRGGQRIALIGPNGSGKTTVLRTISGQLQPFGGNLSIGESVRTGYMAQEQELLDPSLSALQSVQRAAAIGETEARNFLQYFLFEDDDPLRPTRELSFGERARLQLALLIAQGSTFLLLDEPINHLDIPSRARFEQALTSFKGTVVAVAHDRYFIERFASHIWTLKDGKIEAA